ncbi:MAG TPA: phosphoribosylglycinamide formyltransferase [Thermoanaerobaculia bacterium]|jgi:phosphoribosylglycinamide formyltransferase-1|nr:phosphoribosylglycinamide formyltransferase [Thermoanaerobaculia bacterium]
MIRLAVLLSGRGSNFAAIHQAIVQNELDAAIVVVISNRADAPGIARAREWGYAALVIDNRDFPDRAAHEREILGVLQEARPDFIALAGYMRLLSPLFLAAYPNRIVNIHPSLLPAFPGVDAQAQALAHGVKVTGCTVHLVDETLDGGPIIVQRCVDVRDNDTVETLAARILEQEHIAYVDALRRVAAGFSPPTAR